MAPTDFKRPLVLARAILAASDPVSLSLWADLLAEDAHVRVGNRPVAVGRSRCLGELERLFHEVRSFGSNFREIWPSTDGESVLMELDLEPAISLPALPIALVARLIAPTPIAREVRFYLDPSPLLFKRSTLNRASAMKGLEDGSA